MSLDKVIVPSKDAKKLVGGIILSSIALSALLTYATVKVDERYVQNGGNTNAPATNYEKLKYIINHSDHTHNTPIYIR